MYCLYPYILIRDEVWSLHLRRRQEKIMMVLANPNLLHFESDPHNRAHPFSARVPTIDVWGTHSTVECTATKDRSVFHVFLRHVNLRQNPPLYPWSCRRMAAVITKNIEAGGSSLSQKFIKRIKKEELFLTRVLGEKLEYDRKYLKTVFSSFILRRKLLSSVLSPSHYRLST